MALQVTKDSDPQASRWTFEENGIVLAETRDPAVAALVLGLQDRLRKAQALAARALAEMEQAVDQANSPDSPGMITITRRRVQDLKRQAREIDLSPYGAAV
ncbi:MAG: hypothetical protein ACO1SV_08745 [Fimbriimonas sp.]